MSTLIVPVPRPLRALLDQNTHPGLFLDKYVPSWSDALPPDKLSEWVQRPAVEAVVRLSQETPAGLPFVAIHSRRQQMLKTLQAVLFRGTTSSPLTLHLARASALENAGLCLHPLYGFAYLPGTGLKGMARAYAETVWLPTRFRGRFDPQRNRVVPDDATETRRAEEAWRQIEAVFGWAPGSDVAAKKIKAWKPVGIAEHDERHGESSGSVVFHDAWPETWPRLFGDIVNTHHRDYYGASGPHVPPPGDWETPVMVAFLAIEKGQTLSFALAPRRAGLDDDERRSSKDRLELARQWLMGALVHEGAGAKTAAGYGGFQFTPDEDRASCEAMVATRRAAQACGARVDQASGYTLELVTPAFFGGLHQFESDGPAAAHDCDLRSATLRGQLRWWWRTMHAAHVDPAVLRQLEASVWGDTARGGAVRVTVERDGEVRPMPFDRRAIMDLNHLPSPSDRKTTPGLTYHSFGMDERDRRRYFLAPGTRWRVRVSARPIRGPLPVEAALLVEQAEASLWLLCHFGCVGAKSRKGFGCFTTPADLQFDLTRCKDSACRLRQAGSVSSQLQQQPETPALESMLPCVDMETPWKNSWFVLDRVAMAAQKFAKEHKHNLEKKALGLPRRSQPPYRGSFKPSAYVARTDRHSSPVQFHLSRSPAGPYRVRVTVFPAAGLPTFDKSADFLQQFLQRFSLELASLIQQQPQDPAPFQAPSAAVRAAPARPVARAVPLPKPQDRVPAVLLAEKTRKGGWKAKHEPSGLSGPIQNPDAVPSDKVPGDAVILIIAIARGQEIAFRYPPNA